MHRHDVLRRQIEIEGGEYRLLHLARIGRAADQYDLAREIDGDHRVGAFAAAVALGVGLERREVEDGEFGNETGELGLLGADQQLADEERVPGEFGINAGLDPVFRVGAAIEVLREEFFAFGMLDEVGKQIVEVLFRHFAIAVPPNRIAGEIVDDGMLILRATAGVMAGLGAKRAACDQRRFARRDRVLIKCRLGQVPAYLGQIFEAEFVGAIGAVPYTLLLHANSSQLGRFIAKPLAGLLGPRRGSLRR